MTAQLKHYLYTGFLTIPSDNGPYGGAAREFGNQGRPDMGNPGPCRGELSEVTEGSIRTAAIIRWPGRVKPDTTAYAMFSIMDFLPTFASHDRRHAG